jgi:uncharacterized Zn finger protein
VEESNDEGETGEEISSCLDIVFKALTQSSLSVPDRMLWAVEAELADEYELTTGSSEFWEPKRPAADWNIVADKLLQRLNKLGSRNGEDRETTGFRRDRLTDWIIHALENAGRREEIIPLCEQEVPETDSYARLVHHLIQANRLNEAEEWIHRGIKATRKSLPGVAIQLRGTLREMREKVGDWLSAAAFRADDFFFRPEVGTFNELRQASGKAAVWPAVRTAVLHYLETGELPETTGQEAREKNIPLWPLPATGLRESIDARKSDFPLVKALLDIAIEEKRPAEVIRWYDLSRNMQNFWQWSYFNSEDKVAEAVAGAYPERAIAIWKRLAENQIAQTKPRAYDQAAVYLNSLRLLLRRMGKEEEWKIYIAELRSSNIRKKRLLAVLDGLSGKPIIET